MFYEFHEHGQGFPLVIDHMRRLVIAISAGLSMNQ